MRLARSEDGKVHALKIFDLSDPREVLKKRELAETEFNVVKEIGQNKAIIKYSELNLNAQMTKNCYKKSVGYIAMEPINGGDLFDWIACSGSPFPEKVARYFFL